MSELLLELCCFPPGYFVPLVPFEIGAVSSFGKPAFLVLERLLSTDGKLWRVVVGQKLNKEKSPVLVGEELSINYVGKDLHVTRPQLLMRNWGRAII